MADARVSHPKPKYVNEIFHQAFGLAFSARDLPSVVSVIETDEGWA